MATRPPRTAQREDAEPRYSRTRKPAKLPASDWQTALRRQYGRDQSFEIRNLGSEPVFSTFAVHNPASGGRYQVSIRGQALGHNTCTCPDFATNDLGTCKHVEFTLSWLQRRRGSKAAFKAGFAPPYSEIWLDYHGSRQLRFRPGTSCPRTLLAQARTLFDAGAEWCLPTENLERLQTLVLQAQKLNHPLRCADAVWQHIARLRDDDRRSQVLAQAYPRGAQDKALRSLVKVKLYPYQTEGALFAARAGRALIGDEMGLGKTVQAVAAAELFARHFGVQRVLVVCPTSLKHQWQAEMARFSDRSVQVIQGLRAQRQHQFQQEVFCKIVHYETLAKDADLIQSWAPDLVIADEAQRIKNWDTIAARALKRIQSPYALVLTGTPLENRLQELISIVQFVDQHRLGPTWRLLDEHQIYDDAGRVIGYRDLHRIGQTLAPMMLRRRKAEVLTQLPERVEKRIDVPLTPEQRNHHDENQLTVTRIVQRWRNTGYLSDLDQRRLQCALQNMRMACNSTWLLDHQTDHGHKVDELITWLDDLLQDPAAKVVVFSQWLGTHQLIERRLGTGAGQRPWGHVCFNGSVPSKQRGALVDRFHKDPQCRLFLATDAGGVGLNLQHAAAAVVNMDMPWNPAVLEQRIGRVHRMGQTRGVQVLNLVGQGCIEEGILSVLSFKKSLFAGVLDGGDNQVFMQGTKLSKFMESVERVAAATGQPAQAEEAREPPTATPAPQPDPWPNLLAAGAALLRSLLQATPTADGVASPAAPGGLRIEPDPATGQPSLRLTLPDAKVMQQLAQALQPWARPQT